MSSKPHLSQVNHLFNEHFCNERIKYIETSKKLQRIKHSNAEYDRVIEHNKELADFLFEFLMEKGYIPKTYNGHNITSINPMFRYSKYHPGMQFLIHKDAINKNKKTQERSIMTLNIFLNSDFDGGETIFYHNNKVRYIAKPQIGRAMIFDSQQFHSGEKVQNGYKYLMRTDIMVAYTS